MSDLINSLESLYILWQCSTSVVTKKSNLIRVADYNTALHRHYCELKNGLLRDSGSLLNKREKTLIQNNEIRKVILELFFAGKISKFPESIQITDDELEEIYLSPKSEERS